MFAFCDLLYSYVKPPALLFSRTMLVLMAPSLATLSWQQSNSLRAEFLLQCVAAELVSWQFQLYAIENFAGPVRLLAQLA